MLLRWTWDTDKAEAFCIQQDEEEDHVLQNSGEDGGKYYF